MPATSTEYGFRVYQVEPADWGEYLKVKENLFQRPWSQRSLFGSRPVFSEWVDLEASAVGWTQHDLDLKSIFGCRQGPFGYLPNPCAETFRLGKFYFDPCGLDSIDWHQCRSVCG